MAGIKKNNPKREFQYIEFEHGWEKSRKLAEEKTDFPEQPGHPEYGLKLLKRNLEASEVVPICTISGSWETRQIWIYKREIFNVRFSYFESIIREDNIERYDKVRLLVMDYYDYECRRREEHKRPRIPNEIKIKVWRRDEFKCARCGRREKLEFDHIVPISKGGSNTLRNIELLCEECNRSKSNKIGG